MSDPAGTDGPGEDSASGSQSGNAGSQSDANPRSASDGGDPVPRDDRLGGGVQTGRPETVETPEQIDWRGWLLVALVVFSFVVIPLLVLYIPEASWLIGRLGFSQRQAYIVFPMLPAILLGLTAVWAAVRAYTD